MKSDDKDYAMKLVLLEIERLTKLTLRIRGDYLTHKEHKAIIKKYEIHPLRDFPRR